MISSGAYHVGASTLYIDDDDDDARLVYHTPIPLCHDA